MSRAGRLRPNVSPDIADAVTVTRFWFNVGNRSNPDECWPWQGDTSRGGYGTFYWRGSMWGAHELALTFATGERRTKGLDTCHACDNPPCCNPDHLRFASRQENVNDAISRGRHARGERNGHARLTPQQVLEIRYRRAAGARFDVLARDYGVTISNISAVVRGDRWAHVGGPVERLKPGRPARKEAA